MEEISQGNPGELTKPFQGFSTELEEMFQENSRSELIGECGTLFTVASFLILYIWDA